MEGCSEQIAEIVEVEGVVNLKVYKDEDSNKEIAPDNDEISCPVTRMSSGGQTRHSVATGAAQGSRRHAKKSERRILIFEICSFLFPVRLTFH